MLTSPQLRAARGLITWSQTNLAERAGVGLSTVRRMEDGDGHVKGTTENLWKIQKALESAGIIFIDEDEQGGPGVRLARTK